MDNKTINIEKTMDLLEEKLTVEYDNYFFKRLDQRLKTEKGRIKNIFIVLLKPLLIMVLLLMNIFTVITVLNNGENTADDGTDLRETIKEEFFNTQSFYNLDK